MSESKDYGEPWRYRGECSPEIVDDDDNFICDFIRSDCTGELDAEHAKRIVQCVNALAGVPDPAGLFQKIRRYIEHDVEVSPCSCNTVGIYACPQCEARALLALLPKDGGA